MNWKSKLVVLAKDYLEKYGREGIKELVEDQNLPNAYLQDNLTPENVVESLLEALTSQYQVDRLKEELEPYQDSKSLLENLSLNGVFQEVSL